MTKNTIAQTTASHGFLVRYTKQPFHNLHNTVNQIDGDFVIFIQHVLEGRQSTDPGSQLILYLL